MRKRVLALIIAMAILILTASFAFTIQNKKTLILYSADAYVVESSYLLSNYANTHSLSFTNPKSGGSFMLARQIAQGNPDDVFISVSLQALTRAYLGNMSPGWAVAFASDEMTLAYSNSSSAVENLANLYRNATESNSNSSWSTFFDYLTGGSLKLGISDPNSDPAGLRAWFMLEAAGLAYKGNESYYVDRVIQNKANITSSSAADLVAPLEAGQIQVLFIYKSAAISLKLQEMELPDAINLGNASLSSFYSQLTWRTQSGIQKGGPILLFITVPKGSKNYQTALGFVYYVVQQNSILTNFGLKPLNPCLVYNNTALPSTLQNLFLNGKIKLAGELQL